MPGDVALRPAPDGAPSRLGERWRSPSSGRAEDELDRLATMLNAAQAGDAAVRRGCAGAHDEVVALADMLGAPVVHALRRQGACRVGQPVRRRHDRADRLQLRLPRDAVLRHAADARHRLPLSPVLPDRRQDRRRSTSGPRCSGAAASSTSAWSATCAKPSRRCCRGSPAGSTATSSTGAAAHYAKSRAGLDDLARPKPARRPHPPAAPDAAAQRARDRRRHLHRRRRHADRVGGALSGDERPAAADRVVQPRLDGQRDGAGDRRPGGLAGPPGDRAVRRWRLHDADGRLHLAGRSSSCRSR